jgi:hypothetical protein
MSNQEQQNQEKTTEEAALETRRRFIKGAGIAAPVVLSLANRSAFGQTEECLSQQVSGNASHNAGSCLTGKTPAQWAGPNPQNQDITGFAVPSIHPYSDPITILDKQVQTGSGASAKRYRIRQTIRQKTQTDKWAISGIEYGVLTTTETTTIINEINMGPSPPKEKTAMSLNSIITGFSVPADIKTDVQLTINPIDTYKQLDGQVGPPPSRLPDTTSFKVGIKSEYTDTTTNPPTPIRDEPLTGGPMWSDYRGGDAFNVYFTNSLNTMPMRVILSTIATPLSHEYFCVAGLLNALSVPNYPMSADDVKNIYDNPNLVPGGSTNFEAFFVSTWT